MTLHDPNLAAHFAHQVMLLKEGKITADGSPADVLTQPQLEQLYNVGIGIISDDARQLVYPKQGMSSVTTSCDNARTEQ
jgi:iron complex transport system ATP-binding protein